MKVALVHYWLVGMRGGEKVLEAIADLYPDADIYTHVYNPDAISEGLRRHHITTSFIDRLPGARRHYQKYLPLMPLALQQLDLTPYDLVISSESGPAKGVLTRADALHVCYCHTPMRYVWNMYHDYRAGGGFITRLLMPWLIHRLRQWDFQSAAMVDVFVANAQTVAQRIRKFYRRDAVVIHPPVDLDAFAPTGTKTDAYLYVGQLVRYKRVDLAIEACMRLGRKLTIIGTGEDEGRLRELAGDQVTFLGRADFATLKKLYAESRALLFPGEEDFGIVPLEASASGTPVIAYRKGGATETIVEGTTGTFFDAQTVESLCDAIQHFEHHESAFDPAEMRRHAEGFATARFKAEFKALIDSLPRPPLSYQDSEELNARS
jgi:glycosyltransferase involved in cell wall biosynthesis